MRHIREEHALCGVCRLCAFHSVFQSAFRLNFRGSVRKRYDKFIDVSDSRSVNGFDKVLNFARDFVYAVALEYLLFARLNIRKAEQAF